MTANNFNSSETLEGEVQPFDPIDDEDYEVLRVVVDKMGSSIHRVYHIDHPVWRMNEQAAAEQVGRDMIADISRIMGKGTAQYLKEVSPARIERDFSHDTIKLHTKEA